MTILTTMDTDMDREVDKTECINIAGNHYSFDSDNLIPIV